MLLVALVIVADVLLLSPLLQVMLLIMTIVIIQNNRSNFNERQNNHKYRPTDGATLQKFRPRESLPRAAERDEKVELAVIWMGKYMN